MDRVYDCSYNCVRQLRRRDIVLSAKNGSPVNDFALHAVIRNIRTLSASIPLRTALFLASRRLGRLRREVTDACSKAEAGWKSAGDRRLANTADDPSAPRPIGQLLRCLRGNVWLYILLKQNDMATAVT
ncbi:hypothetical protein KIN20_023345 [Parelaphostrongylus tenuis]|uniref:Uncharacterized protein n=1 Tax=Parelaphostrongylus tenuis TaxID=148309 RepID=A0AAD5N6G2_PARTN|nr:hypothetical protein KIN20_023345 [Parelaphostrongylus tenuis]